MVNIEDAFTSNFRKLSVSSPANQESRLLSLRLKAIPYSTPKQIFGVIFVRDFCILKHVSDPCSAYRSNYMRFPLQFLKQCKGQ